MSSEVRSSLKTCSTCKATFSSLREMITHHEKDHLPKLPIDHSESPVFPPIGNRPPIQSTAAHLAGSSILEIRDKNSINPADSGSELKSTPNQADSNVGNTDPVTSDQSVIVSGNISADRSISRSGSSDQSISTVINKISAPSSPIGIPEPTGKRKVESSTDSPEKFLNRHRSRAKKLRATMLHRANMGPVSIKIGESSNGSSSSSSTTTGKDGIFPALRHDNLLCEFCYKTFSQRPHLSRHQLRFHYTMDGKVRYFCHQCSPVINKNYFPNRQEFAAHMNSAHGITIGESTKDSKTLDSACANSSNFLTSNNEVGPAAFKTKWFCEYCLGSLSESRILEKHKFKMHGLGTGKIKYFCRLCSKQRNVEKIEYFRSKKEFQGHVVEQHGYSIEKDQSGKTVLKPPKADLEDSAAPKVKRRMSDVEEDNEDHNISDQCQSLQDNHPSQEESNLITGAIKSEIIDEINIQASTAPAVSSDPVATAWTTMVKEEPIDFNDGIPDESPIDSTLSDMKAELEDTESSM